MTLHLLSSNMFEDMDQLSNIMYAKIFMIYSLISIEVLVWTPILLI